MNSKRILLIEDDNKKLEDIKSFVNSIVVNIELNIKQSYQSGLKELFRTKYDLLLLDMSIPTWDKSTNNSGGEFQKFGGYTIMQELSRKGKFLPIILISMFDEFGESDRSVTLVQIDEMLKDEFPNFYLGSIYYSSSQTEWKDKLEKKLNNLVK